MCHSHARVARCALADARSGGAAWPWRTVGGAPPPCRHRAFVDGRSDGGRRALGVHVRLMQRSSLSEVEEGVLVERSWISVISAGDGAMSGWEVNRSPRVNRVASMLCTVGEARSFLCTSFPADLCCAWWAVMRSDA